MTALLVLAIALVLVVVVQRLTSLLQSWLRSWIGARLSYALGSTTFAHLLQSSASWRNHQRIGDVVRRVNDDVTCVRDVVLGVGVPLLQSIFTLTAIILVMWQLDWVMALVALGAAVPMGAAIRIFAGPMTERSYEQAQQQGELMAHAEQTLGVVPIVQAFRREDDEYQRFRRSTDRTVHATLKALASQIQFRLGVDGASAAGMGMIMLVGGYRALAGQVTIGDLYVFLSYLTALYTPLQTLACLASSVATAKGKARRVFEVLDADQQLPEPRQPQSLPSLYSGAARSIELDGVTFGYRDGSNVLDDVSLTIAAGEHVALIGTTGAGKSTLASLVLRFADPWRGVVRIDGCDVRELASQNLRAQIAWVPQTPMLLPMTVADNIAMARPDADRQMIINAATAAGLDGDISRLPHEYDTIIGERGATLSGGQAQRLAIARAVIKDAPIVILDEATASLDAQTESQVVAAIARLTRDRTTLTIAHRLSTVRRADRIIVLDQGRIVESGTHRQLINKPGIYAQFHQTDTRLTNNARIRSTPLSQDAWFEQLDRARRDLQRLIPSDATVILIDQDQFGGDNVADGRRCIPFTEQAGIYNGPPADSRAARAELDRLLTTGATYLVFGWPAFWWLDHYKDFRAHLRSRYHCVFSDERLVIFDLQRETRSSPTYQTQQ